MTTVSTQVNYTSSATSSEPVEVGLSQSVHIAASARTEKIGNPALVITSAHEDTPSQTAPRATIPIIPSPDVEANKLIGLLRQLQIDLSVSDVQIAYAQAQKSNLDMKSAREASATNQANIDAQNASIEESSKTKKTLTWVMAVVGTIVAMVFLALAVVALPAAIAAAGAAISSAVGFVGTAIAVGSAILAAGPVITAVIGAAMAVWDLVAKIIMEDPRNTRVNAFGETVPNDVSFSGQIRRAFEDAVKNNTKKVAGVNGNFTGEPGVMTREQFEKEFEDTMTGITVTMLVGTVIFTAGSIYNMFKSGTEAAAKVMTAAGAEAARATTQQMTTGVRIATATLSLASPIVSGFGGMASTIFSTQIIEKRKGLFELRIEKADLDELIESAQMSFETAHEHFKSALDFQDRLRNFIASAMEQYVEQSFRINRNC